MPDEENTQPTLEPTQPEPISTPPVENPISEPNPAPVSPDEPTAEASIPPIESVPVTEPPRPTEASQNPESAILDKDQNPANEPFDNAQGKPSEPAPEPLEQSNITIEKHGNDVTITEVMQPTAPLEPATAQMAGNEPLGLEKAIKPK